MNHVCVRVSSDKGKILNAFNKQSKTKDKTCYSASRLTAHCKCVNHYSSIDGQHKVKRLKSRKERSQMRGGGAGASKSKSHHQRQTSTDKAHFHNCCHSSYHCPSKREVLFPSVVPAAQEPSIITDSRLIGHQGLFNHEVKSVAIERLFSEQQKLEQSGEQVHEKSNATSHPSSASPRPSPSFTNNLLGAATDKVVPFKKSLDPSTKIHDDYLEQEKKISQGSDLTPGQRPRQQNDLSSENFKSVLSPKHSSLDVVIIKSWKTDPVMSEKEVQLTPTVDRENVKTLNSKVKGNVVSTLKHTPQTQESPVHQTQAPGQSPLQLSSPHSADSFDIQHRRQDPSFVSKSVGVVAAGLCDSLQLPLLRRRSLVMESREVLLKALKERHGPQLQENLLKMQHCLSFGTDAVKEDQDQDTTKGGEGDLLPTDGFTTAFQVNTNSQPCFGTQKTTSFKISRSGHFNWKPSPQVHHRPEQTSGWFTSPMETSVSLLDDLLRPTRSPQFCMDFEPSGVAVSDHLLTLSSSSCWGESASSSQHPEDRFYKPQSKEDVIRGSFENSFMNHTKPVTKRRETPYSDSNIQPFFSYQAQLPETMHFPQEQGRVEAHRYSVAPPFSSQVYHPHLQLHSHLQPFSQFSHPSICPSLRSHQSDMLHYPPSHMLDKDPALLLSSFPSPEHWSFPPMRLY